MRAVNLLKQYLRILVSSIHEKRMAALYWAVKSLLCGGKLALTALGRSAKCSVSPKHNIKRMDRLLGNKKLHLEVDVLFGSIASLVVGSRKRPVILIDWTPTGLKHHALVAAVPLDGRALPIYVEVHTLRKLGNPTVERRFLKRLRQIIDSECRPIIVTDAGFKNNWFAEVCSWGWDFVGRVRGRVFVHSLKETSWIPARDLFRRSTSQPSDLGKWILSRSTPVFLRLVTFRKHRKTRNVRGQRKQRKARERANEPWLLATSLEDAPAKKIVSIYAKRMQIEETFRDTKNHKYGWCFCNARSISAARIQALLLIAALGMLAVTLLGQAAEQMGLHKTYQANTIHNRRVLSLFVLGMNLILLGDDKNISMSQLRRSLEDIRGKVANGDGYNSTFFVGIP